MTTAALPEIDRRWLDELRRELDRDVPPDWPPGITVLVAAVSAAALHAVRDAEPAGPREALELLVDVLMANIAKAPSSGGAPDRLTVAELHAAFAERFGELAALDDDAADTVLELFAEDADRWTPQTSRVRTRRLVAYAVRPGPVEVSHAGDGVFCGPFNVAALTVAATIVLEAFGDRRPELAWPKRDGPLGALPQAAPRAWAAATALRRLAPGGLSAAVEVTGGPDVASALDALPHAPDEEVVAAYEFAVTRVGGPTRAGWQYCGTGTLSPVVSVQLQLATWPHDGPSPRLMFVRDLQRFSRDAVTLFGALEVVLAAGVSSVVTLNRMVGPGIVARRATPVAPHHVVGGWQIPTALIDADIYCAEHAAALTELAGSAGSRDGATATSSGQAASRSTPAGRKIGRNERCLCGSGVKYKRCCQ